MTGKVKRIVETRGFGFISVPGDKNEYFFHRDDFNGHWDDMISDLKTSEVPVEFDAMPVPSLHG